MDVFVTGTISIPHLGHLPAVSLITSGCILQVYFTDAIIGFEVSDTVAVVAAVSFVISEELLLLQAAKTIAAKNIDATIACFMCVDFYNY